VAVCSARIAEDPDPDRATVVVHASVEALAGQNGGCEIEGGGVIPPQTARRLLCHGRIQAVLEDSAGDPVGLGRMGREPPAWMLRHLRYRDQECRFPGCGARRFTQAHHIVWWEHGGRTDLGNLVPVCFFHHKLGHEHGWKVKRARTERFGGSNPTGSGTSRGRGRLPRRFQQNTSSRPSTSDSPLIGLCPPPRSAGLRRGYPAMASCTPNDTT